MLSYINVGSVALLNFYIFKGKHFTHNFITKCESSVTMVMQFKTWIITILFDKWISHFIAFVQNFESDLCLTNHHLFILNDHNSHVTLDVILKTMSVGLDLITPPSHTSHAL